MQGLILHFVKGFILKNHPYYLLFMILIYGCGDNYMETSFNYGIVEGKVIDSISFQPIDDANIYVNEGYNRYFSDSNGNFVINQIDTGNYKFQVQKISYREITENIEIIGGIRNQINLKLEKLDVKPSKPDLYVSFSINSSAIFEWFISNTYNDSLYFNLYLDDHSSPQTLIAKRIVSDIYTVNNLKKNTYYYFKVTAIGSSGQSTDSDVMSFYYN